MWLYHSQSVLMASVVAVVRPNMIFGNIALRQIPGHNWQICLVVADADMLLEFPMVNMVTLVLDLIMLLTLPREYKGIGGDMIWPLIPGCKKQICPVPDMPVAQPELS